MAKGLRSKSKRRVKAVRRVEIAPVNRVKLLKTLAIDVSKITTPYVNEETIEKHDARAALETVDHKVVEQTQDMEVEEPNKKLLLKQLQNKDGNYPNWLKKRDLKKMKGINKRATKAKNKNRFKPQF